MFARKIQPLALWALTVLGFVATACTQAGTQGFVSQSELEPLKGQKSKVYAEPAGENCALGGQKVSTWTEVGIENGVFDAQRDKDLTNTFLCREAPAVSTLAMGEEGNFGLNAVEPSVGLPQGQLTIRGVGFDAQTTVKVGTTACTDVNASSPTTLTCSYALLQPGSHNVTVTSKSGTTKSLLGGFVVQGPAPALTGVSPSSGPLKGGTLVTLTGSDFIPNDKKTRVLIGDKPCIDVVVQSASSLTCTTPYFEHAGPKSVAVANPDLQVSVLSGAFSYVSSPWIASISPNRGPQGGPTTVTLTGTGFQTTGTTQVRVGSLLCLNVTVASSSSLTCDAQAQSPEGARDVTLVNPDGQQTIVSSGFFYDPPLGGGGSGGSGSSTPLVLGIDAVYPKESLLAGGKRITLMGSAFEAGTTVTIGGAACTGVVVSSPTTLTCVSPSSATAGSKDIMVTKAGANATLTDGFSYFAAPTLASINPSESSLAGQSLVTLSGTGFRSGMLVTVGGEACRDLVVASANTLTCLVPPRNLAGSYDVRVIAPDAQMAALSGGFVYRSTPLLTSLSPSAGPVGGGTTVTLSGSGFQTTGTTVVTFGGSPCSSVNVTSTAQLTCVSPAAPTAGARSVMVVNPDGGTWSLPNAFSYVSGPSLIAVNPTRGSQAGGTLVTLTGQDFHPGMGVSIDGAPCAAVVVSGPQFASCTAPALASTQTPAQPFKNVVVTNPDAQQSTLVQGYRYNLAPTLATVSPQNALVTGGQTLVLTGTGFLSGAVVTVGTAVCTSPVTLSDTQIQCVLPPQSATGAFTVSVTNPDAQSVSLVNAVTYKSAPFIHNINPNYLLTSSAGSLTLTGSGFQTSGATVVRVGGTLCLNTVVSSATALSCDMPSQTAPGNRDVTLVNPDGSQTTATQAFAIVATGGGGGGWTGPTFGVSSYSPGSDKLAGGVRLNVKGSQFASGMGVTIGGVACGSLSVSGSDNLYCTVPSGTAGPQDIVVTKAADSITIAQGFSYFAAPTLSGVSPASGGLTGGTLVTLTGTGFRAGMSVTVGGFTCVDIDVASATSASCYTPPSPSSGARVVVVTNPDAQGARLTNGFSYQNIPYVAGVTPLSGPLGGGTTLTVTGTGFASGATVTLSGVPCTSVTVVSSAQITCVTGAAATSGPKNVIVTNTAGGVGVLESAFQTLAPPALASLSPNKASQAGGTLVTLLGAEFRAGASVNIGGAACTSVTVSGPGVLSCALPALSATSNPSQLTKDVTVTQTDGQAATLAQAFSYNAQPTLSAVTPATAFLSGGSTVILTGSGFISGAVVTMGSAVCAQPQVLSATQIQCAAPPQGSTGPQHVTVTNPDAQSVTLTNGITYKSAPFISNISPQSAATGAVASITITGTGFQTSGTTSVRVGGSQCANVVVSSATSLGCDVPAQSAAGGRDVTLINPDGAQVVVTGGFSVTSSTSGSGGWTGPTFGVSSLNPLHDELTGGARLSLRGTDFAPGMTITVGGNSCSPVNVTGTEAVSCLIPAGSAGPQDIVVTKGSDSVTIAQVFSYVAPPTLTAVAPTSGALLGGTLVTLTGTQFQPGMSVSVGGFVCGDLQIASATSATCLTPQSPSAGAKSVVVTNFDGQTARLNTGFTYLGTAPGLTNLSPSRGAQAGGTLVTLTGSGFLAGMTVTVDGASCTSVNVSASNTATCLTPNLASTTAPGQNLKSVTLTLPDSQSTTLNAGFTYNLSPIVTSVSPNLGASAGGTTLVLTGNNFVTGATVTLGGAACSSPVVNSPTQMQCVTPSGSNTNVTVAVTNPDGASGNLASAFSYLSSPRLFTVLPLRGPLTGGTTLSVTGAGFVSTGTTTVYLGTQACTSVSVASSTTLTCQSPATTVAGRRSVTVFNPDGTFTALADAYLYDAAPALVSVTPNQGPQAGGTTLTLQGSDFRSGASVTIDGAACTSPTVSSSGVMSCVSPALASTTTPANRVKNVVLTNSDGQSVTLVMAFTYNASLAVTGVQPSQVTTAGGTTLVLTGTGIAAGTTIAVGGKPCTSPVVLSATQVQCVTMADTAGVRSVTLTGPDGQTATLSNSVTFASPALGVTCGSQTDHPGASVTAALCTYTDPGTSPVTYSLSGTCTGVSINSSTGALSGVVPASACTGTVTMTSSVASQSASFTLRPYLSLAWGSAPTLNDQCLLTIPGTTTLAGGAVYNTSAGSSVANVTTLTANANGLSGTLTNFALGQFATTWTGQASSPTSNATTLNRTLALQSNLSSTLKQVVPVATLKGVFSAGEEPDAAGCGVNCFQKSPAGIAVGVNHVCALADNGQYCWGDNVGGKLGDGTTTLRAAPTKVLTSWTNSKSLSGVYPTKVSTGAYNTCALLSDATVACWGHNGSGNLGLGYTSINIAEPNRTTLADVVDVETNGYNGLALLRNGDVWAWGYNYWGTTGNGDTTDQYWPTKVKGLSNATQIALNRQSFEGGSGASAGHWACALVGGVPYCWGDHRAQQLGDGTAADSAAHPLARPVVNVTNAVQISIGTYVGCARINDGTVKCWGYAGEGSLGNNTTTPTYQTAVTVTGLSNVTDIAVGWRSACALVSNGSVYCWGRNASYELGDNTATQRNTPVLNLKVTGVKKLTASYASYCATLNDDTLRCWGANNGGQLGNNGSSASVTTGAASTFGNITGVTQVSMGIWSTCALLSGGDMWCAGQESDYTRFGGGLANAYTPVMAQDMSTTQIAANVGHTCAVYSNHRIRCWGKNDFGQLGTNDTNDRYNLTASSQPLVIFGAGKYPVSVSTGAYHTCAVLKSGNVECWGNNTFGQLGDNSTVNKYVPNPTTTAFTDVIMSAAGEYHSCVLRTGGSAMCWGLNSEGQLGDAGNTNYATPRTVQGGLSNAVQIAAGDRHTCALINDGTVRCWGSNSVGQLGNGTNVNSNVPVTVSGLTGVVSISAGNTHTCALRSDRTLRCWGNNTTGQLGDGTTINRNTPVAGQAQLSNLVALGAGGGTTCVMQDSGIYRFSTKMLCFGNGWSGQMGTGVTGASVNINTTPVEIPNTNINWTRNRQCFSYQVTVP